MTSAKCHWLASGLTVWKISLSGEGSLHSCSAVSALCYSRSYVVFDPWNSRPGRHREEEPPRRIRHRRRIGIVFVHRKARHLGWSSTEQHAKCCLQLRLKRQLVLFFR
jgi:hypothetical protein